MKMKKTSLFDTIFYFLKQVRSKSRICKGSDIAVILTEKRGGAVDNCLGSIKIILIFIPERDNLASS